MPSEGAKMLNEEGGRLNVHACGRGQNLRSMTSHRSPSVAGTAISARYGSIIAPHAPLKG